MKYNGFILYYDWRNFFKNMERSKILSDYGKKGAQIKKEMQNLAEITLEGRLEGSDEARCKSPPERVSESPPEAKTRQEKTRQEETRQEETRQDNSSLFSSPSSPSLRGKKVTEEKSSVTKTTRKNEFTPPSVNRGIISFSQVLRRTSHAPPWSLQAASRILQELLPFPLYAP